MRKTTNGQGGAVMSFYNEMREYVLRHGAINNSYLDRFRAGALTDAEF